MLGAAAAPAGGIDCTLPGVGIRLAATRWPGEGVPVVLLHGLASQRRFWNLVVPHLASRPLLALDQRGHGDSDRPADGYDPVTVAADLATAMDALGWSRAVVVGHSWGAAVATAFAADHPHRSLAVVAIDGGFIPPPASEDRAATRRILEPPRIELPPDELIERIRRHTPGSWTPERAAAVLPIFEVGTDGLARARLPFEVHMRIVDTLLEANPVATLSRIVCPVWFVSCESTGDTSPRATARAEGLATAAAIVAAPRILRWEGAVHDVPLQWPALVAGLVRAAADEVAGSS